MREYPRIFSHPNHAAKSLDNLLEEMVVKGATPAEMATAWRNKCAHKQADLDAAADEAGALAAEQMTLDERQEAQA
jgi:hypothetical protein